MAERRKNQRRTSNSQYLYDSSGPEIDGQKKTSAIEEEREAKTTRK